MSKFVSSLVLLLFVVLLGAVIAMGVWDMPVSQKELETEVTFPAPASK